MRAFAWVLLGLMGVAACGKSEGDGLGAADGAGASAGSATGGSMSTGALGSQSASGAGSPGGSGTPAGTTSGGAGTSGAPHGGAAQSGAPQAGSPASGAAGQPEPAGGAVGAGGTSGLVDCDQRKILCKRATPNCGEGEVPSVEGTCYGDCVKVESCACNSAEQCPRPEQYTCWMQEHCGPFVR